MAKLEQETVIALESVIHAALEDLSQTILDEYNIKIQSVHFQYDSTATTDAEGREQFVVRSILVQTKS